MRLRISTTPDCNSSSANGFSMVELLVALSLTGILMAGMAQVFKSTISSFYQSGDALSSQRRGRWAFARLEDDLRMLGHTDGFKDMPTNVSQVPFRIVPGGTADIPLDSVEFFCNIPVEENRLKSDIAADNMEMILEPSRTSNTAIQAGDWFLLKDGMHSEKGFFASAPLDDGSVSLMSIEALQDMPGVRHGLMNGATGRFVHQHKAGAVLSVLRPMQMIQYSIKDLKMDPDASAPMTPCLIRRQVAYDPSGGEIPWESIEHTLVAENVSSLQVDMSVDGGSTWSREGKTSWGDMVLKANETLPVTNQIADSQFWFKKIPILLKVQLHTRSAIQRVEYSKQADRLEYQKRSLVMMIAPRNCGLP